MALIAGIPSSSACLRSSAHTRNIISRFDTDEKLKLLIVVDKLLTGFDEPKNTVLYIDKPL
ncbi:hypothetical protein NSX26_23570, partial [Escherichia coli]